MIHSFPPIIDERAEILILGSIPSVASLRQQQYYGHPQNRFWHIMEYLNGCVFADYQSKLDFLKNNRFALWDVIASCQRPGSLDSNITDIVDNDITALVTAHPNVKRILCNGKTAGTIYEKQFSSQINLPHVVLPSTSPANASYSLQRLLDAWLPFLQS